MSKKRVCTVISVISIVVMAISTANASSCHSNHAQKPKVDAIKSVAAEPSHEKIHLGRISMISQSIDNAIRAVRLGKRDIALAEMEKAKKLVESIKSSMEKSKFANTRCPIMGSPINPDKVPNSLVRDYKGQKIAFCCGGCPASWDKLADAEKNAKLDKAR